MAGVADLIVVTGPPGAGKTTVTRALSGLFKPSALVAGDQFFAFIDQGYIAPWTPRRTARTRSSLGPPPRRGGWPPAGTRSSTTA
jgi:energy-coupling factor transporter ATP-binding protein EcfA2